MERYRIIRGEGCNGCIPIIKITESKEPIDAAYEMLCWCIENGYVKVGKEE